MKELRQPFSVHPILRASLSCALLAEFVLLTASSCALCGMKLAWFPTDSYLLWKALHVISGVAFVALGMLHTLANFRVLLRHLRGVRGATAIGAMLLVVTGTLIAAWQFADQEKITPDTPAVEPTTYATPEE